MNLFAFQSCVKRSVELDSPCTVSLCVNDKCCGFTCLRRDIAPAFTLASPGERHLESAWTVVSVWWPAVPLAVVRYPLRLSLSLQLCRWSGHNKDAWPLLLLVLFFKESCLFEGRNTWIRHARESECDDLTLRGEIVQKSWTAHLCGDREEAEAADGSSLQIYWSEIEFCCVWRGSESQLFAFRGSLQSFRLNNAALKWPFGTGSSCALWHRRARHGNSWLWWQASSSAWLREKERHTHTRRDPHAHMNTEAREREKRERDQERARDTSSFSCSQLRSDVSRFSLVSSCWLTSKGSLFGTTPHVCVCVRARACLRIKWEQLFQQWIR